MSLPAGSLHPDFEQAPAHQQYRANVERLWPDLNVAAKAGGNAWAKCVTPTGLHVALRILDNGARQVAIGRDARFTDANEWTAEVAAWRRRFGATGWDIEHGETKAGGPKAIFTESIIVTDFFDGDGEA